MSRALEALMQLATDTPDLTGRPAWHAEAACRDEDPDTFFPGKGDTLTIRRAKAICAGCTVRDTCLDEALERREQVGIWGGIGVREMRAERIRRGMTSPRARRSDPSKSYVGRILLYLDDQGGTFHGNGAQLVRSAVGHDNWPHSILTYARQAGYVDITQDGHYVTAVTITPAGLAHIGRGAA